MSDFGWFSGAQKFANVGTVTSAATSGTQITAPGSNNTKGAYTQLSSAAPFDVGGILVSGYFTQSSGLQHALADIAVGAASSEVVVLPNLLFQRQSSAGHMSPPVLLPCTIPAGTRISARYQCSTASGSELYLSLTLIPAGGAYPIRSGVALALGATTATSKGTQVDPGAAANTKGSYAELTASHGHASNWALLSVVTDDSGVGFDSWAIDLAIGAAASEQIVVPNLLLWGDQDDGGTIGITRVFMPLALPSGVRVAARAQCSSATSPQRLLSMILHTFA